MVYLIAKETNLYQYTNWIFYGDLDRDILFEKCLNQIIDDNKITGQNKIYYVDDRKDNLQVVKDKFVTINIYHCYNMYELYKFKDEIKSSL